MTAVILFVFGTIVGSFLNVVGLRWDKRNFGGRSICPSCDKTLRWWELVPILSFFALRAKCKRCGVKISWQYPLIEVWTGLIFATLHYLLIPVFCVYVVITIYDSKHKIIPDELVYTAILLSIIIRFMSVSSVLDWLAGPIIFVFFGSIWLLSRGRAMGFGDAKLGLSVGLLLGAVEGFSAIILSFWIGAVVSVAYLFLKRSKGLTMKSEVPFAPFIIFAAWISSMLHLNILHVALF